MRTKCHAWSGHFVWDILICVVGFMFGGLRVTVKFVDRTRRYQRQRIRSGIGFESNCDAAAPERAKFSASLDEMMSHEFDFLAHLFRQSSGPEQSDRVWRFNCFIPEHQVEQAVEAADISLRAAESIVHRLIKVDDRRPFRRIDVEVVRPLPATSSSTASFSRNRSSVFRYTAQCLSQAAGSRPPRLQSLDSELQHDLPS